MHKKGTVFTPNKINLPSCIQFPCLLSDKIYNKCKRQSLVYTQVFSDSLICWYPHSAKGILLAATKLKKLYLSTLQSVRTTDFGN
jgi:hypothetical protein